MIERRITDGLSHWPRLAAQAGLPEAGWQAELINSRRDPEANRVVLRLIHPSHDSVILKQGFGKGGEASVGGSAAPQQKAESLLQGQRNLAVPKVLAAHPEGGALLMADAPGERLADLVDQEALLPALQRAGAWLDAFHRAGRVEERAFQPRFMLDHLTRLSEQALEGKRSIPRAKDFAAALSRLRQLAETAKDARTVSSLRHGDLNARNLLIAPELVTGLDFGEAGEGPVGYDIARLLLHLTELSTRTATVDLVERQLLRAFFTGYQLTKRRDGSLPFLYFARLLSDWASLAAPEKELSVFKALRLERIVQLAKTASNEKTPD